MKINQHQPVMVNEVINELQVKANYWYVDATLGMGGHTEAILKLGAKVIAFEWDKRYYSQTSKRLNSHIKEGSLITIHDNFRNMANIVESLDHSLRDYIRGVLFDFGTSVPQLTSSDRGFSFQEDGPLDMRMFPERQSVTAADLLAFMNEKQLTKVLRIFGGEHSAKKIARAIKVHPEPITTVKQLVSVVEKINQRHGKLHPATKTFQALRIAVNSELDHIEAALPEAFKLLHSGNRLVAISFHEGEDRIVKHTFQNWQRTELGKTLYKKPLTPSEEELKANPRSRSAKLRVFKKR